METKAFSAPTTDNDSAINKTFSFFIVYLNLKVVPIKSAAFFRPHTGIETTFKKSIYLHQNG